MTAPKVNATKLSATKLALAGRSLWAQDGALRVSEPIAIVGMAMRFPGGVTDPESLWRVLLEGRDLVREVPAERWSNEEWFAADPATPAKVSTRWGGFLDDVRAFDAPFFDVSRREAERMDPKQRIALEVAIEAIERAGIPLPALRGTSTGVYFSSYHNDYELLQYGDLATVSGRTLTGTLQSVIPNRISYVLGLHGPSMLVDSACSSSLVSVHLASQALRSRDCDLALVGGINVMVTPHVTVALSKGGFMSPTGHCWTFEAAADGFVRSEGCAVVVLKRLADAIAAGDPVLAVVRGSAVNQDGQSTTLSAPNGLAQAEMLRAALRNAGLGAEDISLVEAHGTGTTLGDPIETDALASVFSGRAPEHGPLYIGSLKSNFGHMEAAAGLAGLIKVVLCLKHGTVPPHALFSAPNPHLNFAGTPLRIATEATRLGGSSPKRAGVSSFGLGGTNAHVIVEEAPAGLAAPARPAAAPFLLPLAARSATALRGLAARYAASLRGDAEVSAVVRAAARRRTHHAEYRVAVTGNSAAELAAELDRVASGAYVPASTLPAEPPLCFVFSGQGTQWPGMALALRDADPVFRAELERVDAAFAAAGELRPIAEIERPAAASRLDRTDVAQATMFAIQVALANTLATRGIRPAFVVGHSVGELAAACIAGLMTVEEGVRAVLDRGAAMQSAFDTGCMVAVRMTESGAAEFVRRHALDLSVAAINGPAAVVLSGPTAAVEDACRLLAAAGTQYTQLDVRFGFHSRLMADAAQQLRRAARRIAGAAGDLTFISTVSGAELPAFTYDYLATNVASPVRFRDAVDKALALGARHFVEIGPHPALGNAVMETAEAAGMQAQIAYCQHRERDAVGALLGVTGRVYAWGGNPDWSVVYPGSCAPVDLPTYAWAHERYWLPETRGRAGAAPVAVGTHAFPGRAVSSPVLERPVFELDGDDGVFRAFGDHVVGSRVRLPATAVLELVRSAAIAAGVSRPVVRDLGLLRAIEPTAIRQLQVVLSAGGSGRAEVFVRPGGEDWITAATAVVESTGDDVGQRAAAILSSGDGDELRDVKADQLYASLESAGLAFGPEFRLLGAASAGERQAEGEILTDRAPEWAGEVNPAVLDAAAHLCIAILARGDHEASSRAFLPWAVDACHVLQPGRRTSRGRAMLRQASDQGATFDVFLLDDTGAPVVWLEGWRLRRATLGGPVLRESPWEPETAAARRSGTGRWLVLEDATGLGAAVAAALERAGHEVARRGLLSSGELNALLSDGSWTGVLHFGALDDADANDDGERLVARALLDMEPLVALARRSGDREEPMRLVLITRGLQAAGGAVCGTAPAGAAALGLLRAARAEAPDLACTALDLEGATSSVDEDVSRVLDEVLAAKPAAEVSIRNRARYVHRLGLTTLRPAEEPLAEAVVLVHEKPGTLDGLVLRPQNVRATPAGHVRVRVLAAGLNFRDVLCALGTYPGSAEMGVECCGEVVEAASDVTRFRPGDRVLVYAPGCFGTYVTAPEAFVFAAPAGLSPAEAATLPVAYGTAWHALYDLGQLRAGQRVLVHAGAGGVGQAAIRLAQIRGARVYATAGSPEKRAWLEARGVAGAFDSRSPGFADALLAATGGEGVDLVLNSLIGELIPAGLRCLAAGGLFVELGKREILSPAQLAAIRADVRYAAFDLRDVALEDPSLLPRIYAEMNELVTRGVLAPLPAVSAPLGDAGAAFRRMARAQHTGKVVLIPPAARAAHSDGWTVVSGGTGGMGAATLAWVLETGARRVAIWSRRGASDALQIRIDELARRFGAEIVTDTVDVARREEVEAGLARLRTRAPITGIVHAAGVLDDSTLAQLTPERCESVLRPKLAGAWTLHRATLADPVQSFVLYSAVGPMVDAAGQGSYSAANAFLDALAVRRRAAGLPAVSIRWGLFPGGGMAERLDDTQRQRWERKGLDWLDAETGAAAFAAALAAPSAHVYAIRLQASIGKPASASAATAVTGADLGDRLRALAPHQRLGTALEHVRGTVTTMLGLAAPAEPDAPLRDLGLDSLSAIELRNALTVAAGTPLPATLAFDYPTAAAIARFLVERLGLSEAVAQAEAQAPSIGETTTDDIDALSDDEAEAMLLAELESMRQPASGAGR